MVRTIILAGALAAGLGLAAPREAEAGGWSVSIGVGFGGRSHSRFHGRGHRYYRSSYRIPVFSLSYSRYSRAYSEPCRDVAYPVYSRPRVYSCAPRYVRAPAPRYRSVHYGYSHGRGCR